MPAVVLLLTLGCASTADRGPETVPAGVTPEPQTSTAMQYPFDDVAEVEATAEVVAELLDPVEEPGPGEFVTAAPHDDLATVEPVLSQEWAEIERMLVENSAPTYDIPMEINEKVLAWVEHYSTDRAELFQRGLERSGRYLPMIRRIFDEEGIPLDLGYMAHVESAYKTSAYSRAHAKGVFQFISATGRHYGLKIDYWEDERSDPEKAARAATRYLKDLYAEFGDWYLAMAAYNAGEGKVRRGRAASGADDFWSLARTRYLRRETKNYVPAILAATIISKDPVRYGFYFTPDEPVVYDSIEVEGAVDLKVLAKCAGTDLATMKLLNPALRRQQTPPDRRSDVRVPVGAAEATLAALAEIPVSERIMYAHHIIRRGDTLWEISRAYGVAISAIQSSNGMGRSTLLKPGRALKIPTTGASGSATARMSVPAGETVSYRVQRGDTLGRISRSFDTTSNAVAANNGMRVNDTIYVGQNLTIVAGERYGAAGASSSGRGKIHTVRRGDTLWDIARVYRTSVNELCSLNRINPRSTLKLGTKLSVPIR
jgi:membrane-bound lytic murein transglycosylase D